MIEAKEAVWRAFGNHVFATLDELQAEVTQRLRPFWEQPGRALRQVHRWLRAQANNLSRRIVSHITGVW